MADFNEYSQKGSTLMQQALKKLSEGDIEGFENDRNEANRWFDLFYDSINSEEGKLTQMYGESRNFGVIYNVIEQNMDNLLETKRGKQIIKGVYDLIKNNKVLNEQFKIYDLFEKPNNIGNAKDFVNEALSVVKKYNKHQIKENNEKLIKFIKRNKLDEFVEIPDDVENLYEAIEYVMLNKKTINNVNEFVKAQNTITEYVEKVNKENINENKTNNETLYNNFDNKLKEEEKKLDENLNEEEKKLIESFTNPKNNTKKIFNNYQKQTLSKLSETIEKAEESDKEGWKKVYESIKNKTYSEKMSDNIVNCAEMMEICNTIDE